MNKDNFPEENENNKIVRALLQILGGMVPIAGGLISAAVGTWSENEQEKINQFFRYYIKTLEDELREKCQTILEILNRLDLQNKEISQRIESKEYQSLANKAFRDWHGAESESKRQYIRNILANAASTSLSTDDVVRLFIEWLNKYSELHFKVIGAIYNTGGITRGEIWRKIGKPSVREDSAEADLYKLLFRDLSTGGIIRQQREKDYAGNFLRKSPSKSSNNNSKQMTSAFDEHEQYELTDLGQQFVHYAMTELSIKIESSANTGS